MCVHVGPKYRESRSDRRDRPPLLTRPGRGLDLPFGTRRDDDPSYGFGVEGGLRVTFLHRGRNFSMCELSSRTSTKAHPVKRKN